MRKIIFTVILIYFSAILKGQAVREILTGKISFVSSQNIYVKFSSTEGISAGDTLYKSSSSGVLKPVLSVTNLSSTSCVCTSIANTKFSVSDVISAIKKNSLNIKTAKTDEAKKPDSTPVPVLVAGTKQKKYQDDRKQRINGSISAYSYTSFSNTKAPGSTRLRYNINLNALNIADSKFSVESYISFNHKAGDWTLVKKDIFNALKIYSLSVKYDINKSASISVGRKINPKISNIGAMDGIQIEKSFGNFSVGLLGGTRPKFTDYGFDSKLIQYGAYLAYGSVTSNSYNQSSLAFMQQTNNGKTDRRFLYFQHSNSLLKNLYFMGTFEVDLYKLKSDSLNNYIPQNTFDITGLYLSLRYKITKQLSLTGAYDERKNVIFYETYKTFMDRILESEMRQTLRLQVDYRVSNRIRIGVQSGYRSLKSDPKPTRNIYGYLSYSQIPGVKISLMLSGTYLETSYLKSRIYGGSLSRDFFNGKLYSSLGYHYYEYNYPESIMNTIQNIGEMNISWQLTRTMSFSANYEGTLENNNQYHMVYLQIRKRF